MAQPTPFTRGYSFTDFSTAFPQGQQPGAYLDAEFDNAKTTLDGILDNLALIQRDDGQLKNASVKLATLHSEVVATLVLAGVSVGAWSAGEFYTPGNILTDGADAYLVAIAHTASSIATDMAAFKIIRIFDTGILDALAESGGAARVGTASGRTVEESFEEAGRGRVKVTDYLDDPETLTSSLINAAFTAALVAAGVFGATLEIPARANPFDISDEFTLPANVRVTGGGHVRQISAGKNIFILSDDTEVDHLGLTFTDPGNNDDLAKQNAIYAVGATNVRIHDNDIKLVDIHCGVQLRNCRNYYVERNRIYGGVWDGVSGSSAATAADILLYSTSPAGECRIVGNFCLSNNSQGIYANPLDNDRDIIVQGNFCVTYDADGETLALNGGVRRHGIIATYNGGSPGRIQVLGNVCRNTRWSGIYLQGVGLQNNGKILVSGNICSLNGYDNNPLGGGIFVIANGGEIITGNIVLDWQGSTDGACIYVSCPEAAGTAGATVSGNLMVNGNGHGVRLGNAARDVLVTANYFYNMAGSDVYVAPSAGVTEVGGHLIQGNVAHRTNSAAPSIFINTQSGTRQTVVQGNKLRGLDNSTNSATNNGVHVVGDPRLVTIKDNVAERFYRGLDASGYLNGLGDARPVLPWDDNEFHGCAVGIGAGDVTATTVVMLERNRFVNCGAKFDGGSSAGYATCYEGERRGDGTVILSPRAATPAEGTWIAGDVCPLTAPAVGGISSKVCTTAGAPGTWSALGIVGAVRAAAVADPTGGATIDTECRAQLAALIDALQAAQLQAA